MSAEQREEYARNVAVMRADGSRHEVLLVATYLGRRYPLPEWRLDVREPDGRERCFEDRDAFDALIAYRIQLDQVGERLLCAGARTDVWPSGMGRSMGGGLKAYVMRYGEQTGLGDLVHIFDEAPQDLVGSVRQQREFFERWASFFFRDRVSSSD